MTKCPKHDKELEYYDGALGYEAMLCPVWECENCVDHNGEHLYETVWMEVNGVEDEHDEYNDEHDTDLGAWVMGKILKRSLKDFEREDYIIDDAFLEEYKKEMEEGEWWKDDGRNVRRTMPWYEKK